MNTNYVVDRVIELQTLDLCHFQHDPYHSEELILLLFKLVVLRCKNPVSITNDEINVNIIHVYL